MMTVLIAVLSLLPAHLFREIEPPLPQINGLDKIVHALMYAALTVAYLHTFPLSKQARLGTVMRIVLISALYGLTMELCQKWLTRARTMDPLDELANTAGALLCALLVYAWARRKHQPS
jgi:VanZ family protein